MAQYTYSSGSGLLPTCTLKVLSSEMDLANITVCSFDSLLLQSGTWMFSKNSPFLILLEALQNSATPRTVIGN
jgi:hypothetical protein